jgi:HD-GYP domain-containing protein (c-di-GMP phosphodiesterase class II)
VFGKHEREDEAGDAGLQPSPLSHALETARELLDLDLICVSRTIRAGDLHEQRDQEPPFFGPLPDSVMITPLESADGRLYGSLVCRSADPDRTLDERDRAYLRVLGRTIGGHIERMARERRRRRTHAATSGMQALLAAVEARDEYTGEHSRSVVELSVRVARQMGLGEADMGDVEQVALLHDVGKVAVPDRILQKPGPLTPSEMEAVRCHPAVGARIVGSVSDLAHLAPAIRSGHERWDGDGYPDGIAGDEIPLVSRITFVCDAYDAMISDRPYRPALPPTTAVAEVRRGAGTQFCPVAARALLGVLDRSPSLAHAPRTARPTGRTP